MSSIFSAALIGGAALCSAAFARPPAAAPQAESAAPVSRMVISGTQPRMDGYAFGDFKGQYELDNGQVLTVSGGPHRYRAELDGQQGAVDIVPAGGAAFVARDGSLRLDFDQHRNGNVSGVTVTAARALR